MSKFDGLEHRVPIEKDNVSIVCNDSLCKKCKLCIKACTNIAGVYPLYDLNKNGDHAVCINCGQCVLACPFNALTEVSNISEVEDALNDSEKITVFLTAPAVRVSLGDAFGIPNGSFIEGKMVSALKSLGADYVLDVTFGADMTVMEEANELVLRLNSKTNLPMFTSCCPGWVSFCEINYPNLTKQLSSVKSPIEIQATLVKTYFAQKLGIDPKKIFVVSVTPCTAKKYECKREEVNQASELNNDEARDCNMSITTRELASLIKKHNIDFETLEDKKYDSIIGEGSGAGLIFGSSGGVLEATLRTAHYLLTGENASSEDFIKYEALRGNEDVKTAVVKIADKEINVARLSGMANAKAFIDQMESEGLKYDFIEVMACPGGCANGGGQIKILRKPILEEAKLKRKENLFNQDKQMTIRYSYENPSVKKVYNTYLTNKEIRHSLLHTTFFDRSYEISGK